MRHPSAFVADCHLIDEPTRELELGTHLGQPLTSGFSCTNAERAQVQAVIGRAVTVAELRRAVGTAVAQAQRDARAASRALRARPRSVRTSRIFPSIFNVPPTFVPSRRPGYASWPDLGRQRPVDAGDAGRPGVARKHRYHQQAVFEPRGLTGEAYWYGGVLRHRRTFQRIFDAVLARD